MALAVALLLSPGILSLSSHTSSFIRSKCFREIRKRTSEHGPRLYVIRPACSTISKPLKSIYPPVPCRFCKGLGTVPCEICNGQGILAKGGFHTKNRVDLTRIIGSKWTAMEPTFGWRHFEVTSKQKEGKEWFLELVATCDPNTRFWVNAQNLKDRKHWSMGWLQKQQIFSDEEKRVTCKSCKGIGRLSCNSCEEKDLKIDIINV